MNKLYLVPTPIGNLDDMTYRAVKVLQLADLILAEDTRKTGILLKHYNISSQLTSHHKFNEHKTVEYIAKQITEGKTVALVSDAGTPGISDPGFLLVRTCLENGIEVECLPGATALVPALINSGLPCDRFCFEGFLPQKKGRQRKIDALKDEDRTMIFYESPHRIVKTLTQLAEVLGSNRKACASREITKLYEENVRGSLADLVQHFTKKEPKGEFVLVVEGKSTKRAEPTDEIDEHAENSGY